MTASAPPLRPDRIVVLIGLMGAGKTYVGRRLAERLDLAFVDADTEVERAAGCTIPDIFETYGEAAFRDCERRVLARLLQSEPFVLATGGGAFMDPATRALIRERGISVWLRADLDLLVSRVGRRNTRPLLAGRDRRKTLEALMAERYPVYAEADIIVDVGRESADSTVTAVIEGLRAFLAARPAAAGAV